MRSIWCLFVVSVLSQDSELVSVHLLHRHGSKIPDTWDPLRNDLWMQFAPLGPGDITPLGYREMNHLGETIRERYIDEESFLPSDFDERLIMVRAGQLNQRPLPSARAFLEGLYPGAPVPIYSDAYENDVVFYGLFLCPSHQPIWRQKQQQLNDEWQALYPGLYNAIDQFTSWGSLEFCDFTYPDCPPCHGVHDCPAMGVQFMADELQTTVFHGFADRVAPEILQYSSVLDELYSTYEFELTGNFSTGDPRGPPLAQFVRNMLDDMQNAADGTSDVRYHHFSAHGGVVIALFDALELGPPPAAHGDAVLVELRRNVEDGQYFVRADYLTLDQDRENYITNPQRLNCGGLELEDSCSWERFQSYMLLRNGPRRPDDTTECKCFADSFFSELGCDDYLNPAVLDIPQCRLFREQCPQISCGPDQVLDLATLLCRVRAEYYSSK